MDKHERFDPQLTGLISCLPGYISGHIREYTTYYHKPERAYCVVFVLQCPLRLVSLDAPYALVVVNEVSYRCVTFCQHMIHIFRYLAQANLYVDQFMWQLIDTCVFLMICFVIDVDSTTDNMNKERDIAAPTLTSPTRILKIIRKIVFRLNNSHACTRKIFG